MFIHIENLFTTFNKDTCVLLSIGKLNVIEDFVAVALDMIENSFTKRTPQNPYINTGVLHSKVRLCTNLDGIINIFDF